MRIRISRGAVLFIVGASLFVLVSLCTDHLDRATVGAAVPSVGAVMAAALFHELGHMSMARLTGTPLRQLRLDLLGARISLTGVISYRREALIAAAGPVANLLSAAPFCLAHLGEEPSALPLWLVSSTPVAVFTFASLALAALNCLPVRTLDGGRLLDCLLSAAFSPAISDILLHLTTALCLLPLWLLSAYALLRVGEMLSLFLFTLILLTRLLARDD